MKTQIKKAELEKAKLELAKQILRDMAKGSDMATMIVEKEIKAMEQKKGGK